MRHRRYLHRRRGRGGQTAAKVRREGVGVSLTVTPCWCYGSETMDMDPLIPKAVWGFNGTERPGAVYLAAVLAAHNQKGLPAFSIYGHDVQDAGRHDDPGGRAGEAAAVCPRRAGRRQHARQVLPRMGGVSMGIAGSIVDQEFFESYLGMRVEVDRHESSSFAAWTKAFTTRRSSSARWPG